MKKHCGSLPMRRSRHSENNNIITLTLYFYGRNPASLCRRLYDVIHIAHIAITHYTFPLYAFQADAFIMPLLYAVEAKYALKYALKAEKCCETQIEKIISRQKDYNAILLRTGAPREDFFFFENPGTVYFQAS